MIIAVVPLLVAIIGLLMYALAKDKIQTVGLALFVASMVALMIAFSHATVRIG